MRKPEIHFSPALRVSGLPEAPGIRHRIESVLATALCAVLGGVRRSTIFPPQHRSVDKGHGRLETREIWTRTALNDYLDFPHVGQVFCIRRATATWSRVAILPRRRSTV